MGDIMRRVENGERFLVTYRNAIRVKLEREHSVQKERMAGLDALRAAARESSDSGAHASFAALYYEHLEIKQGNHGSGS